MGTFIVGVATDGFDGGAAAIVVVVVEIMIGVVVVSILLWLVLDPFVMAN